MIGEENGKGWHSWAAAADIGTNARQYKRARNPSNRTATGKERKGRMGELRATKKKEFKNGINIILP